jgi:predicted esterase
MKQVSWFFCRVLIFSIAVAGQSMSALAHLAEYKVLENVVYGKGVVGFSDKPRQRNLLLDAYTPAHDEYQALRPAIILAFGGAFHRGEKGNFQFSEDGANDSSMADYCLALVRRGFACFSIEYRLTPEDPAPPEGIDESILMSKRQLESPLVTGRVEFVRQKMGLPPLGEKSREQLWNATFAAVDDMEAALNFVRANSKRYNVDPKAIALGGFSAGAMTAINLAYGKRADVSAVVALSGTSWGYNLNLTLLEDAPPLLLLAGQWDLPGIRQGSAGIVHLFKSRGAPIRQAWVPGFGHFYPMEAPSLSAEFDRQSIIERVSNFLSSEL